MLNDVISFQLQEGWTIGHFSECCRGLLEFTCPTSTCNSWWLLPQSATLFSFSTRKSAIYRKNPCDSESQHHTNSQQNSIAEEEQEELAPVSENEDCQQSQPCTPLVTRNRSVLRTTSQQNTISDEDEEEPEPLPATPAPVYETDQEEEAEYLIEEHRMEVTQGRAVPHQWLLRNEDGSIAQPEGLTRLGRRTWSWRYGASWPQRWSYLLL